MRFAFLASKTDNLGMNRILLSSLVVISTVSICRAALGDASAAKALSYKSGPAQTLSASEVTQVKLKFEVVKGMHVQANPANPPLIATNVSLASNKDLEVFSPKYPAGKVTMVKGLGREIITYEDTFEVSVPVRPRKHTKAGTYNVDGEVRYQACDDKLCFPPQKAAFSASVTLKK